jgi:hypothetical protein
MPSSAKNSWSWPNTAFLESGFVSFFLYIYIFDENIFLFNEAIIYRKIVIMKEESYQLVNNICHS